MPKTLFLFAMLGLTVTGSAFSQDFSQEQDLEKLEELGKAFVEEIRRLEVDIDEYTGVRQTELEAMEELAKASELLDIKLGDPSVSPARLRQLEQQVETARRYAFERSKESSEERKLLYQHMERADDLLAAIERGGVDIVATGAGITGTWSVNVPEHDVTGVMSLYHEGALVRGSFLMSTGARGSLRGTFSGNRLDLELIDSALGRVGSSRGMLDPESGEISGAWQPLDLSANGPSWVKWSSFRLTIDDLLERN